MQRQITSNETDEVNTAAHGAGIGRRTFLAGAIAAGVTAACSSSDGAGDTGANGASSSGSDESDEPGVDVSDEFSGASSEIASDTFILAQRFPNTVSVPGEVRLPHSLSRNAEFVNDGPAMLGAQVVDLDGNAIGDRMMAPRYDVTPAAYYVWSPTIAEPGFYSLVVDGGPAAGASFQVFDPSEVGVPLIGQTLGGFDTPTVDDARDVDPICTRDPFCPFHSVTLAEALNVDRGVAFMIGTPAFCQTGTCAPALESLIEVEPDFADDFVFLHAEVFDDLTATTFAPIVAAAGLNFEPSLFITNRSGEIVDRIDAIWGTEELRARLTAATA